MASWAWVGKASAPEAYDAERYAVRSSRVVLPRLDEAGRGVGGRGVAWEASFEVVGATIVVCGSVIDTYSA